MEEKRGLIIVLVFIGIVFGVLMMFFVNAETDKDSMIVKASILKPTTSISVPDLILLGNVTKGYVSKEINISIKNTGTTDITVNPQLSNSSEIIFKNLYLKKAELSTFKKIGAFNFTIDRPTSVGGVTEQELSIFLDLSDYNETMQNNLIDHGTEVVFWATSE